jgi:hypothetical protein
METLFFYFFVIMPLSKPELAHSYFQRHAFMQLAIMPHLRDKHTHCRVISGVWIVIREIYSIFE